MFLTQQSIADHPLLMEHFRELQANRSILAQQHEAMIHANRALMSPNMLHVNSGLVPNQDFWKEIDRQTIQMRDQETGMEIVNDLLRVQTVLPIGKTVKMYQAVGDIADDVAISIDGQAPYSFDHTDYAGDGDPIPVFTAGYGVNWRHAEGQRSVGVDLVLDSRRAKLRKFYKQVVAYALSGSSKVNVDGKAGQGIKNHRNTIKINLGTGAGGVNIDLTTASQADLAAFFTTGALGQAQRSNFVDVYDILWFSPQIMANLNKPATVTIGGTQMLTGGSVLDVIRAFIPAREIQQSYALSGNEFLGYQRRQDVITPLVGMALGDVPLPRPLPQTNFNYQMMSAMGMQITRDGANRSGVVYGANLA
ncbi:major capsid protein [Ectopseudomonas mendocina]|uniref:Major capsid protein n=1 Tax=Ectopseudomonas mendocina TaxID=300 RepID=A0ABZ2RBV8_ECTME